VVGYQQVQTSPASSSVLRLAGHAQVQGAVPADVPPAHHIPDAPAEQGHQIASRCYGAGMNGRPAQSDLVWVRTSQKKAHAGAVAAQVRAAGLADHQLAGLTATLGTVNPQTGSWSATAGQQPVGQVADRLPGPQSARADGVNRTRGGRARCPRRGPSATPGSSP
jgi:hypothetical protein